MDVIRARSFLMLVSCCLLTALFGCSGGQTPDIPEVDTSQLPLEQQVLDWARKGELGQVKSLIDADPSLRDVTDASGKTPLHMAAAYGHTSVVQYLLEQGADPNAADVDGYSPADAARQEGYTALAKVLVDAANQVREQ